MNSKKKKSKNRLKVAFLIKEIKIRSSLTCKLQPIFRNKKTLISSPSHRSMLLMPKLKPQCLLRQKQSKDISTFQLRYMRPKRRLKRFKRDNMIIQKVDQ